MEGNGILLDGADFGLNIGLGKATFNLGYSLIDLCDFAKDSAGLSALLGRFEGGISFDPNTFEFIGLNVGLGLTPGNILSFIQNLVKGNSLARAYVNNMISFRVSTNARFYSIRRGSIK